MQHASRNTQATGILLFFSSSSLSLFFSFFFVYLHVHTRFPLVQIFLFKSFAWEEKSRENPCQTILTNFSPIFPYDRISILRILIFDIYFILRKKKYVIRFGRGGKEMSDDAFFPSPRRSTTQPFLSSFSPLPSSLPRTLAILNPDFMVPSRGEERLAV